MDNKELIAKIKECVVIGKINKNANFPPAMRGQDGAEEYTKLALDQGIRPSEILNEAFIAAMEIIGQKYAKKRIFVPQMLVSAKAMNISMEYLKPYFDSGIVKRKGKFIIGTVEGDLHDLGKNLVSMIVKGAGWEVIDLGVDVNSRKFIQNITDNSDAVVGLSALLTTTMQNMKTTVQEIKKEFPNVKIIIGGSPVNEQFKNEIGADNYPEAVKYLNSLVAKK
jgi:methanogenic corrinoid protein MtbC1